MKVIQLGDPFAGMEAICCQCKKLVLIDDESGPTRCLLFPVPGTTPVQIKMFLCHDSCFSAAQAELESRGNQQYLHAAVGLYKGSLQDPQQRTVGDFAEKQDLEDEDYE